MDINPYEAPPIEVEQSPHSDVNPMYMLLGRCVVAVMFFAPYGAIFIRDTPLADSTPPIVCTSIGIAIGAIVGCFFGAVLHRNAVRSQTQRTLGKEEADK